MNKTSLHRQQCRRCMLYSTRLGGGRLLSSDMLGQFAAGMVAVPTV